MGLLSWLGRNVDELVKEGYPLEVAKRISSGELPMDEASRAAREEAFGPKLLHGSTHPNIRAFDASGTNPKSDFGRGLYASNSPLDVEMNYARVGPDLTSRISLESERVADTLYEMHPDELADYLSDYNLTIKDYETDEAYVAERIATEMLKGESEGVTYPIRVNTKDFAVVGGDRNQRTFLSDKDYVSEVKAENPNMAWDDIYDLAMERQMEDEGNIYSQVYEALKDTDAYQNEEAISETMNSLLDELAEGQLDVTTLDSAIRDNIMDVYDDATGDLVSSGEIVAQTLKNLGYKGVIDNTVNAKFGTGRQFGQSMAGVAPDTQHVITFPDNENMIRSVFAAFDPEYTGPNILGSRMAPTVATGLLGGAGLYTALKSDKATANPIDELRAAERDFGLSDVEKLRASEREFAEPNYNQAKLYDEANTLWQNTGQTLKNIGAPDLAVDIFTPTFESSRDKAMGDKSTMTNIFAALEKLDPTAYAGLLGALARRGMN